MLVGLGGWREEGLGEGWFGECWFEVVWEEEGLGAWGGWRGWFEGVGFFGREGVGSEENRPTERRIDVEGECIAKQHSRNVWKWDTSFQPDQYFSNLNNMKLPRHVVNIPPCVMTLKPKKKGVLERYYHLRAHPRWKGFIAPWTVRH